MGNVPTKVIVKKRVYHDTVVNVPYAQLEMIRVLQREFNYEVKGIIYVDGENKFKSFEVHTDRSETSSYGASDWKISFHTHPDSTAQKYGIRYYSPPSVDDVMEIYEYCEQYVPDTARRGEVSIIFANEGIYVFQVNRESFAKYNKENMPMDLLEEILNQTLTSFLVTEIKRGMIRASDGLSVHSTQSTPMAKSETKINMDNPDITVEQFTRAVKRVADKVTSTFGFDMMFYSWKELEQAGLTMRISNLFLTKKVDD
jgi:hypothetical protein